MRISARRYSGAFRVLTELAWLGGVYILRSHVPILWPRTFDDRRGFSEG